ncbi:hypothetical protein JHK87_002033 [Glycine soja]|nr:hypothetical protein JHK87_002033 [Glycine soja]
MIPTKPSQNLTQCPKIFVFDASVIDGLKAKYAEKMALQKPPSRVEALTTFIWTRFISSTQVAVAASDQRSSYELVEKLREEIRKIDRDYILKLQEGSEYLDSLREDLRRFENIKGEVVPFTFTALCRFPVYDADFGWGKPIWACPPAWLKLLFNLHEVKL